LEELQRVNPPTDAGYRKYKHHEYLTRDVGYASLSRRLYELIGMARASENWEGFYKTVQRNYPRISGTLVLPVEAEA
jgi:hypothetical protein